jgi:hypothetical protein
MVCSQSLVEFICLKKLINTYQRQQGIVPIIIMELEKGNWIWLSFKFGLQILFIFCTTLQMSTSGDMILVISL